MVLELRPSIGYVVVVGPQRGAARGGPLDDRSRVLLSACLGAIIGGVGGYLFLTEDGSRVRERLEPGMDDLLREIRHLRSAVEKARLAAEEGWTAIEDLRRPVSARASVRPPTPY
jgi:hypothetical protein